MTAGRQKTTAPPRLRSDISLEVGDQLYFSEHVRESSRAPTYKKNILKTKKEDV